MIYPHFQCIVSGDDFHPARVPQGLANLVVENRRDPAPGVVGRVTLSCRPNDSLELLVDCLESHSEAFRQCGASDFEVYAAIRYEDQANWELPPDLLARLGHLGVHLLITLYQ